MISSRTTSFVLLAVLGQTGIGCTIDTGEQPDVCLAVELVAKLGRLGDSVSVTSGRMNVARLRDHGWAVLDLDAEDVLLYSFDGLLKGAFVRRGAGPGEVSSPHGLAVDAWDSLWVSDRGGQLLVVAPDGTLGRTISGIKNRVHGFTADGKPFGVLVKGVEVDTAVPYAQIWTRVGEEYSTIGPGSAQRWSGGRSVNVTLPAVWVMSDTVGFSGMTEGNEAAIHRWSEGAAAPWTDGTAAWQMLEPDGEITPERIRIVSVTGAGNEAIWALGRVYGLEPTQETVLGANARLDASMPLEHEDGAGLLMHYDIAGDLREVLLLNQYPGGFIDADYYYTVGEDPSGLIAIGIWRIRHQCK